MNSFITGLIGTAQVLAAVFFAFASGFNAKTNESSAKICLALSLLLVLIGIALLLVRS